MIKSKKSILYLIVIFSLFIFTGCNTSDYKFGVIYTSDEESSSLSTYDSKGNHIDDKSIKFGGITLASFMKDGIKNNDYIYYAAPISKGKPNNYILQIDMKNLSVKPIKSDNNINPTFFSVDDKNLYSGFSNIEETYISKTDVKSNRVIKSNKIKGQGIFLFEQNDNIYVVTIIHDNQIEKDARLYVLNKSNLEISKEIKLNNVSFITDVTIVDDKMYLLVNRDGKDNLSKRVLQVNLLDNNINEMVLPFENLYKLHKDEKYIYIVESSYHGMDTENRVAKININNLETKIFSTKNNNISSCIFDNKYISSDGNKIYTYSIDDFKLLNEFKLKQFDNKYFASFYIK